jgi:hypothetical protein
MPTLPTQTLPLNFPYPAARNSQAGHGIETSRRRSKTGEVTSSRNFGTNIFVNSDGRWRMAFHQSTVIPKT